MNLADFGEIIETRLSFEVDERYKVLGQFRGESDIILVECNVCKLDPELYGEGVFKVRKSNIRRGATPCGCKKPFKYSESQMVVVLKRQANSNGFDFEKFTRFNSKRIVDSRCLLRCPIHGEWETSAGSIMKGSGCTACFKAFIGNFNRKSDEEMVASFIEKGRYPPGTTFQRSAREDRKGWRKYWDVNCSECDIITSVYAGVIQQGILSCKCGKAAQKYAYISLIKDGDLPLALKFGVSVDPARRVKLASDKLVFDYDLLEYWKFPNTDLCKAAEREVKYHLETRVMSKYEVPDGYTETTHIRNLEAIREIYRSFMVVIEK